MHFEGGDVARGARFFGCFVGVCSVGLAGWVDWCVDCRSWYSVAAVFRTAPARVGASEPWSVVSVWSLFGYNGNVHPGTNHEPVPERVPYSIGE